MIGQSCCKYEARAEAKSWEEALPNHVFRLEGGGAPGVGQVRGLRAKVAWYVFCAGALENPVVPGTAS